MNEIELIPNQKEALRLLCGINRQEYLKELVDLLRAVYDEKRLTSWEANSWDFIEELAGRSPELLSKLSEKQLVWIRRIIDWVYGSSEVTKHTKLTEEQFLAVFTEPGT